MQSIRIDVPVKELEVSIPNSYSYGFDIEITVKTGFTMSFPLIRTMLKGSHLFASLKSEMMLYIQDHKDEVMKACNTISIFDVARRPEDEFKFNMRPSGNSIICTLHVRGIKHLMASVLINRITGYDAKDVTTV